MSFVGTELIVDALPPDGVNVIIPCAVPKFVPVKVILDATPVSIGLIADMVGVLAFVATQRAETVL